MILKMMDRTEMYVDQKEGAAIRQSLTRSSEGFITVRGTTIKKSAIMKLEEGGSDPKQGDLFNPKALIDAPMSGCRGQHSIKKEVMRRAIKSKQYQKMQDPKWRQQQIEAIRAEDPKRQWCDQQKGECYCDKQLVNR